MRQCGETLEPNFRDQCDKRRCRQLKPKRVDLNYPNITYWWQQTEDMQEQTTRMRLEIMRETETEIQDIFFSLYGEGQEWWAPGFSSATTITRQWADTSRARTCKAYSRDRVQMDRNGLAVR